MQTSRPFLRWLVAGVAAFALSIGVASAKPRKQSKQKPDLNANNKKNAAKNDAAKNDALKNDALKNDAKNDSGMRPPGDPRANEGAQGRRNATEDAARAAEGPGANTRRP